MAATTVVVGAESSSSLPANNATIAGAHCSNGSCNNNAALDLDSIAPIVNAGFRAVLAEASKLGVLDPPHGRTPMPDPKKITDEDPFVSEEDPFASEDRGRDGGESEKGTSTYAAASSVSTGLGGARNDNGDSDDGGDDGDDDDDDSDEKLLEYKFDYGFNPLVFLGEYLRRNNPVAIRARDEQHDANLQYLRQRAARCLGREAVFVELNELVVQRRSGIVHGPIVGEVSDCGGIIWARTFRPGQLTVELSRHEDFRTICRQEVAKVDQSTGCSAVVEFDDLDPNAVWYRRAYLHNPRHGFDDPPATFSLKGKFWTLPERDQDDGGAFRFAALSLHGLGVRAAAADCRDEIEAACSAISACDAKFCLALGEPSAHPVGTARSSVASTSFGDLQETTMRTPALARLLQGHAFLTASGPVSNVASNGEEEHQRIAKNKRGSNRAEGALAVGGGTRTAGKSKRGGARTESDGPGSGGDGDAASTSLDWPIRCPEAWGSRPLGPTAEMFIIDARTGVIGDEQLSWVVEAVAESHRTWKVIACGVPVGFPVAPSMDLAPGDKETTRQNAAATTIQASLRSRLSFPKDPVAHSNTTKESSATSAAAAAAAGAAVAEGGESSPPPRGKEGGPTPKMPAGSDVAAIGAERGGGAGGGVLGDGANISRATLQMQDMVSQLYTSGCKNVVLITPARSSPHALSFFSGHEAEGKFPVHELGCSGLVPFLRGKSSSSGSGTGSLGSTDSIRYPGATTAEPCPELAPEILIPGVGSACGGGGVGVACTVSFGTGREEDDGSDEDGGGDWLSFSVCGASGESISSLRLAAVTQ